MLAELTIGLEGQEPLTCKPQPMTVVVGPNGAGKSTLLREIEAWFGKPDEGLFVRGVRLDTNKGSAGSLVLSEIVRSAQKPLNAIAAPLALVNVVVQPHHIANFTLGLMDRARTYLASLESREESTTMVLDVLQHVLKGEIPEFIQQFLPFADPFLSGKLRHSPWKALLKRRDTILTSLEQLQADFTQRLVGLGLKLVEIEEAEARPVETPLGDVRPAQPQANSPTAQEEPSKGAPTPQRDSPRFAEAAEGPNLGTMVHEAIAAALGAGLFDGSRYLQAVRHLVRRMDGAERLGFVDEGATVRALLQSPILFEHLRSVAQKVFHIHLGLELFDLDQLDEPPEYPAFMPHVVVTNRDAGSLNLSLSPEARAFFEQAKGLSDQGDGVRAFLGLITANAIYREGLVLVDEPEAFLHPPLARRLARHLAEEAERSSATCICATHSAAFLQGCLDSGRPVSILRIGFDRQAGNRSLHLLDADQLKTLLRDPVVRSAGVLDMLFADTAILCEGETDCLVFRTAYETVLGDQLDCAPSFVSTGGKGAISGILGPLRQMGVRVAALFDFDLVIGRDFDFSGLLRSAGMSEGTTKGVFALRDHMKKQVSANDAKAKGLAAYTPPDDARKLLDDLAAVGIFVLPWGELESVAPFEAPVELPSKGSTSGKKAKWAAAVAGHIAAGQPLSTAMAGFIRRLDCWLHPKG